MQPQTMITLAQAHQAELRQCAGGSRLRSTANRSRGEKSAFGLRITLGDLARACGHFVAESFAGTPPLWI